ncbi:Hypp7419 [Branchiostoma lanceolatum]|nr:Hypp7419 [Branchiostoma lanceolatum]
MDATHIRNSWKTSINRMNASRRNMKLLLKGIHDQIHQLEDGGNVVPMATIARHHRLGRLTEILDDVIDILKTLRRVLKSSETNDDSVVFGNIANMAAETSQDSSRLLDVSNKLPTPSETEGPAIEQSILDIHMAIENILKQLRSLTEEGRRCTDNQFREMFGNPRLHPRTVDALQRKLPERYIRDIPVAVRESTIDED